MLSRIHRFHGHGSVRRAYRQGRPVRSGLASVHIVRKDEGSKTKVAVVVSRKVDKSAVRRNRIRRRLYELTRHEMPHFRHPVELVITVYAAEMATLPANELRAQMIDLFKKAKLY